MAKEQLSKELPMAKRYRNRPSISLIIREMQIKITIKYSLTSARMATIKKTNITISQDVEKRVP
jgi:hypothetical protein